MAKHGITRRILCCPTFIEISADEFNRIKAAKANIMHALFVEEKLNYVLENYREFEQELLEVTLDSTFLRVRDWTASVAQVHAINRRIVNLLAACRLYDDQVTHNVDEVFGRDSQQAVSLKEKKSEEYDSRLGYRSLCEMRNYVQHRGFPIHRIGLSMERIERGKGTVVKHTIVALIDVSALAADKKFKPSIREELEAIGTSVDIKPLIREYVGSIGRIHSHVRSIFKEQIPEWEKILDQVAVRFRESGGNDTVGLAIVTVNEAGKYSESIEVFEDPVKRRAMLVEINARITHFDSHFVSSEVASK